jgi:hypothetical protein
MSIPETTMIPYRFLSYPAKNRFLLFVNDFLSVVRKKKLISDFRDLNQGPKSCLQSSRHPTTFPPTPSEAINIIYHPTCFGGNSHSDAACNFCPDQLGCVWLPRPVRVHQLPRKLGLRAAAPIVRVECSRGVG